MSKVEKHPASFRDPSGYLFERDGRLLRQVNRLYAEHYEHLMSSGLYERLVGQELLVRHEEVPDVASENGAAYKILKPELLPFISYPYEWCFSQLRDAALCTLAIQRQALEQGMWLKDASAYNIQFHQGKPILIDTLSLEKYVEGRPWVAYRQFCQHFLAPLALMAYDDARLGSLMRVHLDGLPLDLATRLLPTRARFKLNLLMHLFAHAASQKKFANRPKKSRDAKVSKNSLLAVLMSLESGVRGLKYHPAGTVWADYYDDTNYEPTSFRDKKELVADFLQKVKPARVLDLGANDGTFSRLAADAGSFTLSSDFDPAAVEKNYRRMRQNQEKNLLPLWMDITNPSPGIGWQSRERAPFTERVHADCVMALALIHHLAIGNNVPIPRLVEMFGEISPALILEFVPKQDSQVQRLLASREDIFSDYTQECFEMEFSKRFRLEAQEKIPGTERTLYLWIRQ